MDALLSYVVALLTAYGPWLVFVITLIETAAFVGLLVPAEPTVLLAAFLADRGVFALREVALATFFGGLTGDQIGYFLGRFAGRRAVRSGGRLGRLWGRYEPGAAALFRRHSNLGVSVARLLSFIRTLMPWFAGMSEMRYGRFLLYDILGVACWAAGSIALGYAAGESWRVVADLLGGATAAAIFIALLVGFVVVRRRRRLLGRVLDAGEA
ncbi:MAG: DedA family protein [Longimicrobiales bacterium]